MEDKIDVKSFQGLRVFSLHISFFCPFVFYGYVLHLSIQSPEFAKLGVGVGWGGCWQRAGGGG